MAAIAPLEDLKAAIEADVAKATQILNGLRANPGAVPWAEEGRA